jgi:hypothetical protein
VRPPGRRQTHRPGRGLEPAERVLRILEVSCWCETATGLAVVGAHDADGAAVLARR